MTAQIIQIPNKLPNNLKNIPTEVLLACWMEWFRESPAEEMYINGIWHEDVFDELQSRGVNLSAG